MTSSPRSTVIVKFVLAFLILTSANLARADWVTIGQPNLPADVTGYGYVPYTYSLSDQVTNAQYAEFMTATYSQLQTFAQYPNGLLPFLSHISHNGSGVFTALPGKENVAVGVFFPQQGAMYINWLQNGKGNGSISSGSYTLANSGESVLLQRNPNTSWFLPNVDEWYKAVYNVDAPVIQQTISDAYIPRAEWLETKVGPSPPPSFMNFDHYLAVSSANPSPTGLAGFELEYPLTVKIPFRVGYLGVIPEPSSYMMIAVAAIGAVVLLNRRKKLATV